MQSKRNKQKQLSKVRRKIVKHMKSLTDDIGKIQASSSPERDFALIFKDESVYTKMLGTLQTAYMDSFKSKMKLFTIENRDAIQMACLTAGLGCPSDKQLSERHYRTRIQRSLEAKKRKDGTSEFEWFRKMLLVQSLDKVYGKHAVEERKKSVTCPKCHLEQKPVKNYVICKCGFQGPVIGNLYSGFSREEESKKLNEKGA